MVPSVKRETHAEVDHPTCSTHRRPCPASDGFGVSDKPLFPRKRFGGRAARHPSIENDSSFFACPKGCRGRGATVGAQGSTTRATQFRRWVPTLRGTFLSIRFRRCAWKLHVTFPFPSASRTRANHRLMGEKKLPWIRTLLGPKNPRPFAFRVRTRKVPGSKPSGFRFDSRLKPRRKEAHRHTSEGRSRRGSESAIDTRVLRRQGIRTRCTGGPGTTMEVWERKKGALAWTSTVGRG